MRPPVPEQHAGARSERIALIQGPQNTLPRCHQPEVQVLARLPAVVPLPVRRAERRGSRVDGKLVHLADTHEVEIIQPRVGLCHGKSAEIP